ncbi:MAG: AraC family transcriptional regulator [Lentisphaeria bacterium]
MKRRKPTPVAEQVTPLPDRSFVTERVVGAVLDCNYHTHPEYEITHVDGGHGTRLVGDNVSVFGQGDLLLIGGGIPHLYHNRLEDSLSPSWARSRVIKFRRDCLGPGFFDLPEMKPVKRLLERSELGVNFPPKTGAAAARVIRALFDEPDEPRRIVHLLELLSLLAKAKGAKALSLRKSGDFKHRDTSRVERVLDWLHRNFTADIGLEEAAAVARLSPESFSRFFRTATRRRFIDYLGELRIGQACRMLSETDGSISRIAIDSGFRNLSNFNRQFRRLHGMTPKAYRASVSACFP